MSQNSAVNEIGVIGAGAWGTALAVVCARVGNHVTLWSRNQAALQSIRSKRVNEAYLPDVFVDPQIEVTDDLQSLRGSDILLLAVPSQHLRSMCIQLADLIKPSVPLVICAKGIEKSSLLFMHELVGSILPKNPMAILSGPNFAKEAADGLPTATTLACSNLELGTHLQYAIGGKYFRPYLTDDLTGTAVGGAIKNVIAIACGIADGAGLGENAQAALMTRGLAEMQRLCLARGGRLETLMGLAGLGDLVLTCKSRSSRNYTLGLNLGQGMPVAQALHEKRRGVIEGVETAESIHQIATKQSLPMPICTAVHDVLRGEKDVKTAMNELLERPLTVEIRQTSL